MHIRSKFDGGKQINRSQAGGWQGRCAGAGLRQNLAGDWGPQTWKVITNREPNNSKMCLHTVLNKLSKTGRGRLEMLLKRVDGRAND